MIEETAVVERVSGDHMEVRVLRPEQCETCAVRENCYTNGNRLSVPASSGIRETDRVRLTITNTSILGLSALMYGIPLAAVMLGSILGYLVFFPGLADTARTFATLGVAAVFMAVAAFIVHRAGKRIARNIEYSTERIGSSDDAVET